MGQPTIPAHRGRGARDFVLRREFLRLSFVPLYQGGVNRVEMWNQARFEVDFQDADVAFRVVEQPDHPKKVNVFFHANGRSFQCVT